MMSALLTRAWFAVAPPGGPLGPVDQDPDAVRAEACKVVSKDASVCAAPKPPKPPATPKGLDLSFISLLLWVLLIAAVVGLLYLLLRWGMAKSGKPMGRRKTSAGDGDTDIVERDAVAVDRSREPTDWRSEAERHRLAGRHREALRCRYRALVGDLARRGLIDEIPGRTTGEERDQMRRVMPAVSSPFDDAADLFDDVWYGHREVDAADDDRFRVLERQVLATATRAAR